MRKPRFTPGPWKWNTPETSWYWLTGDDGESVLEYEECGSHQLKASTQDRALIAAAPDLYAVLDRLLKEIKQGTFEDEGLEWAREPFLLVVAATLAKARGEEPSND